MFNLPKPKLGDVTGITMSSPDLETSFKFYNQLGFHEILRSDFPFPLIQITDGALLILLRYSKEPYCSLTYYVRELDKTVAELEQAGISFFDKPKEGDMIRRFLFKSPDDLTISLVTFVEGFQQPPGPNMLTTPQEDYFNPDKYVNKVCGMYGEYAHPVTDLDVSITFWEKLGFTALSKMTSPYPWAIVSDGLAVVGLHQTTNFSYPVITFFAADMKSKIEKLKLQGLENFTETGSGNIVITTPEQQHINLFKMGM